MVETVSPTFMMPRISTDYCYFKYHTTTNAIYTCVHSNVCKDGMKNNFQSLLVAEKLNEILILEYMF